MENDGISHACSIIEELLSMSGPVPYHILSVSKLKYPAKSLET